MTVKELKEKLNEFPDEMEIGGSGHFGEILELRRVELCDDILLDNVTKTPYVILNIESAGPDPDDHWD